MSTAGRGYKDFFFEELFSYFFFHLCLMMSASNIPINEGAYDKFPDFFRVGTFIDSTHMKFKSPSK